MENKLKRIVNKFLNEALNKKLILYHGTNSDFNEFDLKFFNYGSSDGGWLGKGIYLTNDYEYAESYADSNDGSVLECEVKIETPFILNDFKYSTRPLMLMNKLEVNNSAEITKKLIGLGYDSVLLKYDDFIEVCCFKPDQIKIINKYQSGDDSKKINHKRGYL